MTWRFPELCYISTDEDIGEGIFPHIKEAQFAFTNLNNLWRRRDNNFLLKGGIHSVLVWDLLLCECEIRLIRVVDFHGLSGFASVSTVKLLEFSENLV